MGAAGDVPAPRAAAAAYPRYDAGYTPVTGGYAPVQGVAQPGEPEVPAVVNEGISGQRVSPFATMQDVPAQTAPAEPERRDDSRYPRYFMDGIPAYMRRK